MLHVNTNGLDGCDIFEVNIFLKDVLEKNDYLFIILIATLHIFR